MATKGKVGLNVHFGVNAKEFSTKMQNVQRTMKRHRRSFAKFTRMAAPVAAGFGLIGAAAISAAVQMESLSTRLRSAFQGDQAAAQGAMKIIKEFAKKTPFQVAQVADSFIKLKNLGLDPSMSALESYGNTASAMGKSLDQMIEAVADAATGEFERLKEFGIKAKKQGDQVAFTFRGVTKTVKFNADSIQEYLLNIGNTDFAGGMAEQSKTAAGQISTLKDNLFDLANDVGQIFLPTLKKWITGMGNLLDKFRETNFYKNRIADTKNAGTISEVEKEIYRLERLSPIATYFMGGAAKVSAEIDELYLRLKTLRAERDKDFQTYEEWKAAQDKVKEEGETVVKELTEKEKKAIEERAKLLAEAEIDAKKKVYGMKPIMSVDMGVNPDMLFGQSIGQRIAEQRREVEASTDDIVTTIVSKWDGMIEQINRKIQDFVAGSLQFFVSSLGQALAQGGFKNGELGRGLLEMTADFMNRLGTMMITTGVSMKVFNEALKSLNAPVAIGAGVALVAGAAAIKHFTANGYGNGSTGVGASASGSYGGMSDQARQEIAIKGVIRGQDLVLISDEYKNRRK